MLVVLLLWGRGTRGVLSEPPGYSPVKPYYRCPPGLIDVTSGDEDSSDLAGCHQTQGDRNRAFSSALSRVEIANPLAFPCPAVA